MNPWAASQAEAAMQLAPMTYRNDLTTDFPTSVYTLVSATDAARSAIVLICSSVSQVVFLRSDSLFEDESS